jgi:hypothetical protein
MPLALLSVQILFEFQKYNSDNGIHGVRRFPEAIIDWPDDVAQRDERPHCKPHTLDVSTDKDAVT